MHNFDYNEQEVLNKLKEVYNKMEFLPDLHSGDLQEIVGHINALRYIVYAHSLRRSGDIYSHDEPFYEIEVKVEPKWGS